MKRLLSMAVLLLLLATLLAPGAASSAEKGEAAQVKGPELHLKAGRVTALSQAPGQLRQSLPAGERGLFVVQFKDVITGDSWKAMDLAGAEVISYLPDFSFLIRLDAAAAADLAGDDLVHGVARYRADWKLPPGLAKKGAAKLRIATVAGDEEAVAAQVKGRGGEVSHAAAGQVLASMDRSLAAVLAQSESVVFIEEALPNAVFNDVAGGIIAVSSTGGPWTNGLTGSGQIVGIADTGLDTGNTTTLHADLKNRLQTTPIALGRTNNWSDTHGHGTHVAGSVLGDGTNSSGSTKGMAPAAKMVFQSLLDSSGGLGGIPADLNDLFSQAAGYGAKIHTNSWGVPLEYGGHVYDAQAQQVDQYTWNNKGFTVLFAAGNDGDGAGGSIVYSSVSTPSTAKNAITVGASENNRPTKGTYADNINQIALFSSRGWAPDGRVKPDVVAPGTWILSTRSSQAPDSSFWGTYNSYYAFMGGTSMATPVTAGATALVRQFYTDVKGIAAPSSSLLKATLINGAQDMGFGWMSRDQGWGRIDITNSLYPTGRVNWYENETKTLATNGTNSYTFTASTGQILKFTLVWTDYAGAVQASKELVNDLDLEVTAPGGSVYKGNCFSSNTASTSCSAFDRSNNVENVYFASPSAGTYTVNVKGYNVPNGPQPYSLVVSGVNLSTGSADTQAPTVSITAPSGGATVGGTTNVTASASDNVGVSRVEFYLDGAQQATDTASPFEWAWNTTTAVNGSHSLTAKAYDAADNVGTSSAVSVTVSNAGSSTVSETQTGTLSSGGYKDVYIDVSATGTVSLSLSWVTTSSDLDLYLFSPAGTQVGQAESGTLNPETISYSATTTGRYWIRVKSYSGASTYTLTASHPIDPTKTGSISQTGSLASGGTQNYTLTVGAAGSINLNLDFPSGTDFDLYLINSAGTTVAQAISSSLRPETISYSVSAAGTYTMRVKAYSGSGSFTLTGYYPK